MWALSPRASDKLRIGCCAAQITSSLISLKHASLTGDYYDRELEYRQGLLGAASIDHLCKVGGCSIVHATRTRTSQLEGGQSCLEAWLPLMSVHV